MLKSKKFKFLCVFAVLLVIGLVVGCFLGYFNLLPKKSYTAEDFGIETIYSTFDYNNNNVDDYTDILLGAKIDAKNKPKYDGSYFDGGYPPDDIGVCTDVVWRAFKNAGYCLRDMVDKDITNRPDAYTSIETKDKNIDFRRVRNLRVFFEKYAIKLTIDKNDVSQWQAGDIVIFGDDKHIGIVSDKRNKDGQTYIIHNAGQPVREEDCLKYWTPTGHYRFDASYVSKDILVKWVD